MPAEAGNLVKPATQHENHHPNNPTQQQPTPNNPQKPTIKSKPSNHTIYLTTSVAPFTKQPHPNFPHIHTKGNTRAKYHHTVPFGTKGTR